MATVLLQFDMKAATALSMAIVTLGSLGSVVQALLTHNPLRPGQPLVDAEAALLLAPPLLAGVTIGLGLNWVSLGQPGLGHRQPGAGACPRWCGLHLILVQPARDGTLPATQTTAAAAPRSQVLPNQILVFAFIPFVAVITAK